MDRDSLSLRARTQHNNENKLKTLYSQVGGHVNMKILDEKVYPRSCCPKNIFLIIFYPLKFVCKPLNRREVKFYQHLPKQLCDLVPKYHGTVLGSHEDSYSYERYWKVLNTGTDL